ncbi:MAG: hypothetical protein EXR71_16175 [Myxococcales bacterium]|nr:hypothetical protein [Myxococcales bacterium]
MLLLCLLAPAWAAGVWWLESADLPDRAQAAALESAAVRAGYTARVVKRFRLGDGWEYVTLVEGFVDEVGATAAARKLTTTGAAFTLVHDPVRGPPSRATVRPDAEATPSSARSVAALVQSVREAHGEATGGAAALARARVVHFTFDREFSLDRQSIRVSHEYWRDPTSRRVTVDTHGAATDSTSVATTSGAWLKVAGHVESRDIGVLIAQADAFAPEAVLGLALEVPALLEAGGAEALVFLEGAESGVRIGRGEDPIEPGLAFADVDPHSGLLQRVRYVTKGGPVTFSLTGWSERAPGVVVPDVLVVERPDGSVETVRVRGLKVADVAPPGTFATPENDAPRP